MKWTCLVVMGYSANFKIMSDREMNPGLHREGWVCSPLYYQELVLYVPLNFVSRPFVIRANVVRHRFWGYLQL